MNLLDLIYNDDSINKLNNHEGRLVINNTLACSYLVSGVFLKKQKNILLVASSMYNAQILYEQIASLVGEDNCLLFPVDEIYHQTNYSYSKEMLSQRLYVMDKCLDNKKRILISHVEGVTRFLPNPELYKLNTLFLEKNKSYNLNNLVNSLINMGFTRVNKIDQSLQFALRGDILDIFPINLDKPIRIEFFDDEIESIRYFEIESQTSIEEIDNIKIFPATDLLIEDFNYGKENILNKLNIDLKRLKIEEREKLINKVNEDLINMENGSFDENYYSYFHYFQKEIFNIVSYFKSDLTLIYQKEEVDKYIEIQKEENDESINELFSNGLSLFDKNYSLSFENALHDCLYSYGYEQAENDYSLLINNIPFVSNNILSSLNLINEYSKKGYKIVICLKDNFDKYAEFLKNNNVEFEIIDNNLPNNIGLYKYDLNIGFIYKDKVLFLSKKEIFNYKQNLNIFSSRYKKATILNSYDELSVDDYVVHEENGIGQYKGIVNLTANGITSDYLKVLYANNQYLYIPLEKFSRIRKYVSKEGSVPRLSKLGGKDWANVKEKIKNQVNFLADRLLALYAEREITPGISFKEDDEFQKEFEDAFPYQMTRDQQKALEEIKLDMEKPTPMDRLLCGDVGFGKTEVAFRAAFKAILSNKQVALLCPTTILAKQHYDVANSRFSLFGVNIALFSRFVSAKIQNENIKLIKEGKIHLIIGTHRLLSKDIEIPNLGLLIVDEEQRFGVEHKEKIKEISKNVDVLTLTATPIPRTLQMSLLGIRNLSQLQTPPSSRMPIQTYVTEYNPHLAKEVICRELSRGGQVFYLYNLVSTIFQKAEQIKKAIPNARVGVVHAKMDSEDIDKIMTEFYLGNIDVLVCTSIVESGLDVPNANTILIENSDKFGLSQLYQIKGRVGRSNRVAYAYLFYNKNKELTPEAEKRLKAIKEFASLGSGYKIAEKDLSIRGAGDILGSQQSGFIDSVGIDMYVNILSEVINEKKGIKKIDKKIKSTNITIGGYIPSNYALDTDKIQIYQEIEDTQTIASIELLRRKLKDIYGKLPKEVEKILLKRKIDILASSSNIESVYEDNMINIILTKEISLTNGVATMLSNKLSVIKDDIFVRVIDKKFIIKIQKNKESQNNLLYILEVINTL